MRFCPPPRRLKVCGFLPVVLSLCALPQRAWAQSSPSVQKIDLSGSGHVRCKDSSGNLLQAVEMDATHTPVYATSAGIQGQNLTAGVTLHHTAGQQPFSGKAHFSVVFEYPDFPNANGQIPITVTPAEQNVTIAAGGTTNLTLTLGALPNQVRGGSLRILCNFKTPEGTDLHAQTEFLTFYVLYDAPTAPQENPWEGVLYEACWWARGENTHDGVAKKLTQGVFFYRFAYPDDGSPHWVGPGNPRPFRLADFLATSGYQSGNCVDVSHFLAICANAAGLEFEVAKYMDTSAPTFTTIALCLIGSDPFWTDTYGTRTWLRHQVCHPVGANSTYDACAAHQYDLSGSVYENPPAGWYLSSYWQFVPSYPKGLVALPYPSYPLTEATYTPGVL